MQQILLIEDDKYTTTIISRYFSNLGFLVWTREDGYNGEEFIKKHHRLLNLIILDLNLPHRNGIQVCENIRNLKIGLPILVLTGNIETTSIVQTLNTGADDYLTKPFSLAELQARVRSLLRRPIQFTPAGLNVADLYLNLDHREAYYHGRLLSLRRKEFDLLHYLLRNRNQTLTRDQILVNVWSTDASPYPNTIDVHIRQLRLKLGQVHPNKLIQTVHGMGYKLQIKEGFEPLSRASSSQESFLTN